ncbi:MAG TPA: MaoC/PaaZ C-terminal domain-containing protein [Thermoleophilaceae bacterium]|jgi:acyl dehydratase
MPDGLFSRWFDALAEGERFVSRGRTITEADIVAFSALTGDWHPQHADAVWAASSDFGERIAHGALVLSFSLGLVDFDPDRVMALRRISNATFKAPTRIGDTIRVEGRVASLRPIDARAGLVETGWRVVNQHGRGVVVFSVDVLWRRVAEVPAVATP